METGNAHAAQFASGALSGLAICRIAYCATRTLFSIWLGLMISVCGLVAVAVVVALLLGYFHYEVTMGTLGRAVAIVVTFGLPLTVWSIKDSLPRTIGAFAFYPLVWGVHQYWEWLQPIVMTVRA